MASKARHIVFEALFVHGLHLPNDSKLTQGLAEAGFELAKPQPEYPLSTFARCLEVARRQRYADLSEADALCALGSQFVSGILNTMLGKVVGVAVLVSGPDRSLKRIPSLIQSDYGVSVTAKQLEPRHYEIRSAPGVPQWTGHFFRGIFEEALRRTRVVPFSSLKAGDAQSGWLIDIGWKGQ